ncbi:MAG TPA: AzlC family ABC transporter permease [candidate division Zixibacteria bacterium]|nr:AzlC family ABC transporter permease [candidate division Zixibacteria bacterium]
MSDGADPHGTIRKGAIRALPFALAVALFGIVFGALVTSTGPMDPVPALLMSATTFAGSAQFAAVSILSAGGQPVTAIVAAVLLNLRYAPIGVTVAPHLSGAWWRRLLTAQLIVDESWAIAADGRGRFHVPVLVGAGLVLWASWVAGTLAGLGTGEALGNPARLGLDAAFPALFLALLLPQLRTRRGLAAALLGGVVALVLVPFTPAGVPIVAASAAAFIGLVGRGRP